MNIEYEQINQCYFLLTQLSSYSQTGRSFAPHFSLLPISLTASPLVFAASPLARARSLTKPAGYAGGAFAPHFSLFPIPLAD